jgi:uncharacterized protein
MLTPGHIHPDTGGAMFSSSHSSPFGGASARQETFELSWELFGELSRALALRVGREFRPDLIIGIATAGVIPGAVIASMLRVEFFSMKISRRSGDVVRDTPELFTAAPTQAAGRRVLLVDEISTSGETFRLALAAAQEVGPAELRTAATFVRPGGFRPDYYALETNALIVFPWDRQVLAGDDLETPEIYEGRLA